MNRCTLFMRLTGVPESSLSLSLSTSLDKPARSPPQISSEPCLLRLPRLPLLSLSCRPAHRTCRWDLTGDSSDVPGILLKKQLCVLCPLECKAYFIPPRAKQLAVA